MEKQFNDMTSQELFETAVKGLFKQGRRCGGAGGCYYRGDNAPNEEGNLKGLKCGVGMVISDRDYAVSMEGYGIVQLCDDYPHIRGPLEYLKRNEHILSAVQMIHDREENWLSEDTLKERFLNLTKVFTSLDGSFIEGLKLEVPANE